MRIYKIENIISKETRYFRFLRDMCRHYAFSYKSFLVTKSRKGLPFVRGIYLIDEIDIL